MESLLPIIVAVVLAFLAFKFVKGLIKFGILALIAIAVIYFLSQGGGA
jgi:predicted PurR-regulated permease PerM